MRGEIISVGTELLLGDILNTNSKYISIKMAELGLPLYRHTTIGDNFERLCNAITTGLEDNDILIMTGGLGPTPDDITKDACAKVLDLPMLLNDESYDRLKEYFADRNSVENNIKQSVFPEGTIILPNRYGTADGGIIETEGKIIIILPGPPKEMEPMFEEYVYPYLSKYSEQKFFSRFYKITGMGEWQMSSIIKDLITSQTNPTIAPYAKKEALVIKLTAAAKDLESAEEMFEPYEKAFKERFKENYLGYDQRPLEDRIGEIVIEKNLSISTAESITGGMVASTLINYPGISSVLKESYIVYSDDTKEKILGVNKAVLKEHSAVSEEVLKEMLYGIRRITGSDICLATTGYAGPDGENVGLAYYGYLLGDELYINGRVFKGLRNEIRQRVTREILSALLKRLVSNGV